MTSSGAVQSATASDKRQDPAEHFSRPVDEVRCWEDKLGIAREIKVSPRSIDNYMSRRIIPFIRIGRVVRFDVAKVKAALSRFEIREAGYRKGGRE